MALLVVVMAIVVGGCGTADINLNITYLKTQVVAWTPIAIAAGVLAILVIGGLVAIIGGVIASRRRSAA